MQKSSNLVVKDYKTGLNTTRKFLKDRQEGTIKSLKTFSPKLDSALLGGID